MRRRAVPCAQSPPETPVSLGHRSAACLALVLAACAPLFEPASEAPEPIAERRPLDGLPVGSSDDTARALVARRDSLDHRVIRLAEEKREARKALLDFARNPSGDHLPTVGADAAGARGAMSDRFRQEVKAEMAATKLVEQEKLIERRLKTALDERDAVCTELSLRLDPVDARRCTG